MPEPYREPSNRRSYHPALTTALLCILAFGASNLTAAQTIAGDWHGTLSIPSGELRLAVHIDRADGGALSGSFVSVDQSDSRMPLGDVALDGGILSFAVPEVSGTYQGTWDGATEAFVGKWHQSGTALDLTLTSGLPKASARLPGLDGAWEGALAVNGTKLRLVLRVWTGDFGTLAALDSPDQLAYGLVVPALEREGGSVRFRLPQIGASFEGTLSHGGTVLGGTFSQGGGELPLELTRRAGDTARTEQPKRPQTPEKPYPYHEQEVAFDNPAAQGVRLAGTLTLPQGDGPFPAAVLITGSGPQDRDESLLGHKPFLVLADYLTRRGIAVLRYDDRGVGSSTGDFAAATSADFATDAAAGVAFLRTQEAIDPQRVGLIGHSEGGMVAPMVAAKDPAIAFTVLLAGPGVQLVDMMLEQQRLVGLQTGQSEEQIAAQRPVMRAAMEAVRDAPDRETALASAQRAASAAAAKLGWTSEMVKALAQQLSSDWWRFFLSYDPAPTLAAIHAPVLALNGSKDVQVPAEDNLAAIRQALAGNPNAKVVELEGLNHLFQTAKTGAVGEYADIEETIAPKALALIGDWIVEQTRRPPGR